MKYVKKKKFFRYWNGLRAHIISLGIPTLNLRQFKDNLISITVWACFFSILELDRKNVRLFLVETIGFSVTVLATQSKTMLRQCTRWLAIHLIHKSHNAPVPYPTMHHSEQKCAHFCSQWWIMGYGKGALWEMCDWSIVLTCSETGILKVSNRKGPNQYMYWNAA